MATADERDREYRNAGTEADGERREAALGRIIALLSCQTTDYLCDFTAELTRLLRAPEALLRIFQDNDLAGPDSPGGKAG